MGRKSHNKTYKQLLDESRVRANEYYIKNREEVLKKKRLKYELLKQSSK